MLKALELIGFKSFADRTRFEFPPGITVVVGPNGSGKSNIVDAIKWVLGEQSVKSLRGKEMVDVIFNGSASRKPVNMAEVTLTFDNREQRFDVETPEVAITRRVYRSGEGEYLINRTPCRLRDIRELFAGTGVATEAYSVIEQGKVDVLLQSSPKERRLIFEEAAGISRFKTKKLECQRRLERVDQNLLRLSDIVDEVESRLKSVRMQATKARRYQEYADRLQLLRTQVAWVDWQQLTTQLQQVQAEQSALQLEIDQLNRSAEELEQSANSQEHELSQLEQELHQLEQRQTEQRERMLALEAAIELDRGRNVDLGELLHRYRRQALGFRSKAGDLQGLFQEAATALATALLQQRELTQRLAEEERHYTTLNQQVDLLRSENEQQRVLYLEQMRQVAALANEISSLEAQLSRSEERREKCLRRLAEVTDQRQTTLQAIDQLQQQRTEAQELTQQHGQRLQALREQRQQQRIALQSLTSRVTEQREQLSRRQERVTILTEWEQQHEGITAGVKSVLQQAHGNARGPWRAVRGMLVDLFQASLEYAPVLEAVLAEQSQTIVYEPTAEFNELLQAGTFAWQGRVTLLPLQTVPHTAIMAQTQLLVLLADESGIVGRLDQLLETAVDYRPLANLLLGQTWLVDDLATAQRLHEKWLHSQLAPRVDSLPKTQNTAHNSSEMALLMTGVTHGAAWVKQPIQTSNEALLAVAHHPVTSATPTFVTRQGEILWPSGALTFGTSTTSSGLFSRRSELRSLRAELTIAEQALTGLITEQSVQEQQLAAQDQAVEVVSSEFQRAQDQLAELRTQLTTMEQRRDQLQEQYLALTTDAQLVAEQSQQVIQTRTQRRNELEQLQLALAQSEARLQQNQRRLEQLDEARQLRNREAMSVKVELARSEQQTENLRRQERQFELDRQERERSLNDLQQQIRETEQRIIHADDAILLAEQQLAQLYLDKEAALDKNHAQLLVRDQLKLSRQQALQESQRQHQKVRKLEEKRQKRELSAQALHLERSTLEDRLREDYQIELATVALSPTAEQLHERSQVDTEINELRRKLTNLGGVNLEALQEATELETRYEHLSSQFQDLTKAKQSLEQIIHKINADSRRLFVETLEQVKEHFQALFRKLFGGGRADILLEENVDILESGIEILARPPGKEPRNISLLSGGEKTLTCVALLLSIFRSRPSPFCVLDEVDAALDEANIERFVGVLNEFLNWTQFIVVTHSKKTMACGNTLYGVTMQESGISKRVSVRFEDVSDNGEIRLRNASATTDDAAHDNQTDAA